MNSKQNQITIGAALLLIVGLASKVLSALYRIPLQNLTGDIGFYLYQQMYPLIAFVMIISLYGFPSAIAKLTVAQRERHGKLTYQNFFLPLFIILFVGATMLAILLMIFSPALASYINEPSLTAAFRLGSLLFFFIPFLALARGVMQADYHMKPTAISQFIEQLVRVTIIVIAAVMIWLTILPVTEIANAGIIASLCGMGLATLYASSVFLLRYPVKPYRSDEKTVIPWRYYMKTLLIFGIFATVNHITFIFMQLVDMLTLVPQLMKAGFSQDVARLEKGIFDRGVPLIQLGIVIGSSFAIAFIPTLSTKNWRAHFVRLQEALALSFYLATGATLGLIMTLPDVNQLLFMDRAGTVALQILALAIFLLSITLTGIAILQVTNHIRVTVIIIVIAIIIKWFGNICFVPIWGTVGSALATVVSLFCLTVLIMLAIKRHINVRFRELFQEVRFGALLKASSVMVIYLASLQILINSAVFSRLLLLGYTLWLVLTGALVFITILLRNDALSDEQLRALPLAQGLIVLKRIGRQENGG